jgi:hypothetical protein
MFDSRSQVRCGLQIQESYRRSEGRPYRTSEGTDSKHSVPDSKDKHKTLSIGATIIDTVETPTPTADPPYYIRHGHSLIDDSGIELSAAELTETEGTN